jgi:hypothetical protein
MLTATYSRGVCNTIRDAPANLPVNSLGYDKILLQCTHTTIRPFNNALNGKQKTALRFENLLTKGRSGGKK